MDVIVDVQGFTTLLNGFVVKEVAVLSRDLQRMQHYIFQQPQPIELLTHRDRAKASWLGRHHHGLNWCDGHVPYGKLVSVLKYAILKSPVRTVYVKGDMKKKFLESVLWSACESPSESSVPTARLPTITDLTDMPSLRKYDVDRASTYPMCFSHYDAHGHQSSSDKEEEELANNVCALRNVHKIQRWLDSSARSTTDAAIDAFVDGEKSLSNVPKELIRHMLKNFIVHYAHRDVHWMWNDLPEHFKSDPEISKCRRCTKHYNYEGDDDRRTRFDGPPPMIKNCPACIDDDDEETSANVESETL